MSELENIAHVKEESGQWITQSLIDHLEGVASLAGKFAESFGNRDWAEFLALCHDLGKFVPDWQYYIRQNSGFESESAVNSGHQNPRAAFAFL